MVNDSGDTQARFCKEPGLFHWPRLWAVNYTNRYEWAKGFCRRFAQMNAD
jgi:hypothetical protein